MKRRPEKHHRDQVYSEEDDTHDMLIKAYLEYYKYNEAFEKRYSVRTYKKARSWLREMNYLAKERAREIIETYKENKHLNARKTKND